MKVSDKVSEPPVSPKSACRTRMRGGMAAAGTALVDNCNT